MSLRSATDCPMQARARSRLSRTLTAAVAIALTFGLSLASSTAQARPNAIDVGCLPGWLCLYDRANFDTSMSDYAVRVLFFPSGMLVNRQLTSTWARSEWKAGAPA